MQIKYYNSNLDKINNLDSTIEKDIFKTISNLPAFNIIYNKNLLDDTIVKAKKFEINKKRIVVFGTGGSNLGARALYNININKKINI